MVMGLSISFDDQLMRPENGRSLLDCVDFIKAITLSRTFESEEIKNALADSESFIGKTFPFDQVLKIPALDSRKLAYLAARNIYSPNSVADHILSIDRDIIESHLSSSAKFSEWLSQLRQENKFALHFSRNELLWRPKKLSEIPKSKSAGNPPIIPPPTNGI